MDAEAVLHEEGVATVEGMARRCTAAVVAMAPRLTRLVEDIAVATVGALEATIHIKGHCRLSLPQWLHELALL